MRISDWISDVCSSDLTLMSEHSDLQVPSAAIYGCAGLTLSAVEESFFKAANPLGFILFARNCETPDQVRELVAALRGSVGRADAPVLIDQAGGRVARLKPPHWRAALGRASCRERVGEYE